MCGRFAVAQEPRYYADHFGADALVTETLGPSYNVAPTDRVYAVAEHDGTRSLGAFRWGLVPFWAEDVRVGSRMINARSETVLDKPAFKDAFRRRRCLIPADGFYEWEQLENGKLPHYIYLADGSPMALAGLWAVWRDPASGERLTSCTILTTGPNQLVEPLHRRMPVILPAEAWDGWLDRHQGDPGPLTHWLRPYPAELMAEHPVSSMVNDVRNNLPELILPLRPN